MDDNPKTTRPGSGSDVPAYLRRTQRSGLSDDRLEKLCGTLPVGEEQHDSASIEMGNRRKVPLPHLELPARAVAATSVLNANGHNRDEILRIARRIFPPGTCVRPHLVVFSSTEHGNGCTSVCIQVAEAMARQHRGTVCLVDANMHLPALHSYFGVGNEYGLSDALLQAGAIRTFVQEVPDKNLWLMSAGTVVSDLHALVGPETLRGRLAELCSEFAYVVVDAPPVNASADSLLLGEMADGLVLVIAANATRREAALKAKETLEASGVTLLGAILNKRTFPIPEALYKRT